MYARKNTICVSATFAGVENLDYPWFCHRWENFLLIIVSEVGQSDQQNGHKLRVKAFLSATIFCKHFDMVSSWWHMKMLAWSSTSLLPFTRSWTAVNFVQSILCKQTCKVLVNWVVKQFFFNISQTRQRFIRIFLSQIVFLSYQWLLLNFIYFVFLLSLS